MELIYCVTMLMCSAVIGLSFIAYGYTQPVPKPVTVQIPKLGRTILRGAVDKTGRLAVINGATIILAEIEKPRLSLSLVAEY